MPPRTDTALQAATAAAHPSAVVVVAGLPGAGKTTLVSGHPSALDSDAVREAMAPRFGRLPYGVWRPLVHARHWLAVWRALARPEGVTVVRPFTSRWLRRAVLRRARAHHPEVHLVVVEATPEQARAGQRARGRTIRERAMRRHERRWARADLAAEPWTTISQVTRAGGCEVIPSPGTPARTPRAKEKTAWPISPTSWSSGAMTSGSPT